MGTLTLTPQSSGVITTSIKHGAPFAAGTPIGIYPIFYTYAGDTSTGTSVLTPSPSAQAGGVITTINKN